MREVSKEIAVGREQGSKAARQATLQRAAPSQHLRSPHATGSSCSTPTSTATATLTPLCCVAVNVFGASHLLAKNSVAVKRMLRPVVVAFDQLSVGRNVVTRTRLRLQTRRQRNTNVNAKANAIPSA